MKTDPYILSLERDNKALTDQLLVNVEIINALALELCDLRLVLARLAVTVGEETIQRVVSELDKEEEKDLPTTQPQIEAWDEHWINEVNETNRH
jgi:hypothetical protein